MSHTRVRFHVETFFRLANPILSSEGDKSPSAEEAALSFLIKNNNTERTLRSVRTESLRRYKLFSLLKLTNFPY